jgi:integrase
VRWDYIARNPAKLAGRNRQPPPRVVRAFTRAEPDAIALELSAPYRPLPTFAAATGLRPEEWAALERRDIDRRAGVVNVLRTVTGGKSKDTPLDVVDLAKTSVSRRQVPLTRRALAALDGLPPRLDTPRLFPAPAAGPLNLDNWRRRERRQRRGLQCRDARAPVRHARNVRQQLARRRRRAIRARARDGHQRADDRATARCSTVPAQASRHASTPTTLSRTSPPTRTSRTSRPLPGQRRRDPGPAPRPGIPLCAGITRGRERRDSNPRPPA